MTVSNLQIGFNVKGNCLSHNITNCMEHNPYFVVTGHRAIEEILRL